MHGTNVIGRLKDGVGAEEAQRELGVIASRIEQDNKQSHAGTGLKLVPLQEAVVGQIKSILLVLLAAVGFVLLIACANVASLLLDAIARAAKGSRHSRCARRQPLASDQATADGISAAVIAGRRRRYLRG